MPDAVLVVPDAIGTRTGTMVTYLPEANPAAVYLARLAPGSRRTMRTALATLAALLAGAGADPLTLPWHLLRYPHTQALRAALAARAAPATTNKHLAALRGVLKEAWRLGLMGAEEHARATDVPDLRAAPLPRGRALTPGELRALFAACADGTPGGVRDAALLAALYGCGLRRAEVVALDRTDYHAETRALTVRHGKGDKARVVYLPGSGAGVFAAWLTLRGDTPGPLFLPVNKAGAISVRRLVAQSVYDLLARRLRGAGVIAASPHDLRRTFVSDLLDAGVDVTTVQKLAGHASVATTARYDRRGEAAKRRAADALHIPQG